MNDFSYKLKFKKEGKRNSFKIVFLSFNSILHRTSSEGIYSFQGGIFRYLLQYYNLVLF